MAANILISILQKWSRDQNLKNYFSKRIFQWNLAQSRRKWIDLHYWNKILRILFRFKMAANFCLIVQYANSCTG